MGKSHDGINNFVSLNNVENTSRLCKNSSIIVHLHCISYALCIYSNSSNEEIVGEFLSPACPVQITAKYACLAIFTKYNLQFFALFPRLRLAVIHYNANSSREKDPHYVMYISHLKYKKGEDTVKSKS